MTAVRRPLGDGRWHLQHGPIDIVMALEGEAPAVAEGLQAAWLRFQPLLDELVAELPLLRQPVRAGACPLRGETARQMWQACAVHLPVFVTPMAAVAGAVAQTLLAAGWRPGLRRAWVNNGGDIALQLAPGESLRLGVVDSLATLDAAALARASAGRLDLRGRLHVTAADGIAGVATSGWSGRSQSLGIADSVTVLARDAATADAAATLVANAVDVDHAAVVRCPASALRDDSDLGDRRVTVHVPPLPATAVDLALAQGCACAERMRAEGHIVAALIICQGRSRVIGSVADTALASACRVTVGGDHRMPASLPTP